MSFKILIILVLLFNCSLVWSQGTKLIVQTGHFGDILSVAYSPNGKMVVTGSKDGTAKLWEVSTGRELRSFKHADWVQSVVIAPNGEMLITGSRDNLAKLWDLRTGEEIRLFNRTQSDPI